MSIVVYLLKVSLALLLCRALYWTYMDHLAGTPVALTEQAGTWSPGSVLLMVYLAVALGLLVRSALRFRQIFTDSVNPNSFWLL